MWGHFPYTSYLEPKILLQGNPKNVSKGLGWSMVSASLEVEAQLPFLLGNLSIFSLLSCRSFKMEMRI